MTTTSTPSIPLLDLRAQHEGIRDEILAALLPLIESQKFVLGEAVEALEREIAEYSGCAHGIGCANGTDALFLALLGCGVAPGDEVITVPFTFFATAGAIVRAGATPVFVDIDPATFNVDPARLEDALKRHPKAKAIIPVHLFGACADMDAVLDMARRRGVYVIEDAAQAIGAEYKNRRAGSMGHVGCFSFFPSKNLGGYGDGGMLTTNDAALSDRLKSLRVHGSREKYLHEIVGINSRLDALQAVVLSTKFRHLDSWTAARQANAAAYRRLFLQAALPVTVPSSTEYQTRHIYNQFVIRCDRRDELKRILAEHGIGTEIYYPLPLHLQPCFRYLGYGTGNFPVSESCALTSIALPVYPELGEAARARVVGVCQDFFRS